MNDPLDQYLNLCFGGQAGFVQIALKGPGFYRTEFLDWPSKIEHIKNLVLAASKNMEVYISPALFSIPNAKKQSVKGSQMVWVEFDGDSGKTWDKDLGLPPPNMIIQSSIDSHVHVYWRIPFSTPAVVEDINRRLTYALEADSSGWDAGQVLRPPMTFNHKRTLPVKVVKGFETYYNDLDKFSHLPEIPVFTGVVELSMLKDPDKIMSGYNWTNLLFNKIKLSIPPQGMRSSFLTNIAYELAEKHLEQNDIVALLKVADDRIGKYAGRSDQLIQLASLAARAADQYEVASQLSAYGVIDLTEFPIVFDSIWGNFLPRTGNLLLAGAPSVGKTQFSFHTAIEMALESNEFMGFDLSKIERLLYVSMEMPNIGMKWLATQQIDGLSLEQKKQLNEKLIVSTPGMALKPEEVENLLARIKPQGVFFDSLAKLSLGEMSNEGEAQRLLNWDSRLRNLHNCFTWYVHHNRKAAQGDKEPNQLSDVYGSYLYGAQMDTVLSFYKHKATNSLKISAVKVRYGEETEWEMLRLPNLTFKKREPDDNPNPTATGHTPKGLSLGFN